MPHDDMRLCVCACSLTTSRGETMDFRVRNGRTRRKTAFFVSFGITKSKISAHLRRAVSVSKTIGASQPVSNRRLETEAKSSAEFPKAGFYHARQTILLYHGCQYRNQNQ